MLDRMLSTFFQDLRFAVRLLRRSPRDTAIAAAILGLGIGANTAMFSAINHVLWRPFPFRDEARLIRLREMVTATDGSAHPFNMSSAAIVAVRESARDVFEDLVAMSGQSMTLAGADAPERVSVALQTEGFDRTLGVAPLLGRPLTDDESRRGLDAGVALVGHAMWETRFARSPAAIGSRVRLDDRVFTIVGVMPPQYAFPYDAQYWLPWRLDPADRSRDFAVWARTRPGVSAPQIADAMARVAALARRMRPDLPPGYGFEVRGIRENLLGGQERPLVAVAEIVGFMLLIASVNVATLLVARAIARRGEFAVRAALGQSRARLCGQLIAESLALAAIGCSAGLLLAAWLGPLTASFIPQVLSGQLGLASPHTDWRVAAFAVAVSAASAVAAGVAPAISVLRTDAPAALGDNARTMSGGPTGRALLAGLVVAETGLTLVLLTGAGLVVRNFVRLQTQPLGFEARGLLAIELTAPPAYADSAARASLLHGVVDEISAAPGVVRAAATTVNPLGGGTWGATIVSDDLAAREPAAYVNVNHRLITPGLLETMGTPVLRGRAISVDDRAGTQPVVVVSDRLARRLWPGREAVGRRLRMTRGSPWLTVVGVAGDVSDSHDPGVPNETIYVPFDQHADSAAAAHVYLMIRSGGQPLALVADVRRAVGRVDRTLAPYAPVAMDAYLTESIGRERTGAAFMTAFGLFGLLLAALGVYGVMALTVAQRRVEFGIRLALGARPSDIVPLVLRRTLAQLAAGLGLGAVAAAALGRTISGLLTGVDALDPATLAAAAAAMLAAGVAACLLPALAAGRLDPVEALKRAS